MSTFKVCCCCRQVVFAPGSTVIYTVILIYGHHLDMHSFLSSAAAGDNIYQIQCSIDSVAQAAFYAYPNTMTNTLLDLETVDVS